MYGNQSESAHRIQEAIQSGYLGMLRGLRNMFMNLISGNLYGKK